jgi:hypothetical protein
MGTINWDRWANGSGVGFVILTIAAFLVGGEPPGVSDPAEDVVSYYSGERGQVLVSSFFFAVALLLLLWFAGAIANALRERGQGRLAGTLLAAVSAFAAVQLVLTGIGAALAHSIAREGDAATAQALFNLSWALDLLAALPSAGFVVASAVGLSRVGRIPDWLGWAGIGVAALFVLRSTNWAREGFWSPTGKYVFILIPLALLWILVTSIVLFRTSPASSEQAAPSATTIT